MKTTKDTSNNPKIKKKGNRAEYIAPLRKPNESEERKMISKAIEIIIVSGMKNHVYKFQNQIQIQAKGGPIGLALTGEVADCCMIDWDKKTYAKNGRFEIANSIILKV